VLGAVHRGCFYAPQIELAVAGTLMALRRSILLILALAAGLAPLPGHAFSFFSFGSGGLSGGYHATARAICEQVNRNSGGELRCSPESTPGSAYNLSAISDGQLDFALVQSDWQRHAVQGTGPFQKSGAMPQIRSVMSLYPEAVTLLVRKDAGITGTTSLAGKIFDIGHPASGRHSTGTDILRASEIEVSDLQDLLELPSDVALAALCEGQIDATILVVGHPNEAVARVLSECNVAILPLEGKRADEFLSGNSDFSRTFIPVSTYPELSSDIPTLAVMATVLTRNDMETSVVQALVSETLSNAALLGRRVPLLADLNPQDMREKGLTAPLHPGAQAAFDAFEAR
jgi:TRAP transporter TAXI family solute receptor